MPTKQTRRKPLTVEKRGRMRRCKQQGDRFRGRGADCRGVFRLFQFIGSLHPPVVTRPDFPSISSSIILLCTGSKCHRSRVIQPENRWRESRRMPPSRHRHQEGGKERPETDWEKNRNEKKVRNMNEVEHFLVERRHHQGSRPRKNTEQRETETSRPPHKEKIDIPHPHTHTHTHTHTHQQQNMIL